MNTAQNNQVLKALGDSLPKHFRYGYDFVDWDITEPEDGWDAHALRHARVVRVWGKDRVPVLFAYDKDISSHSMGRHEATSRYNYRLLFLNIHGEMVEFSPHDIENQWRKDNGKSEYAPVSNKVVEQYLRDNGARSFTGRGWADDLAISLCGLVRRWGKHYNKNLFKAE